MKTVRRTAFEMIEQILQGEQYSNLLLNEAIQKRWVDEKDVPLLTELVYGTIQRLLTLDFYLEPFIHDKRVEESVRNNLRLAVYQAVYLDRIPPHAIVHEAVEIAKADHPRAQRFINGVLRSFFRHPLRSLEDIHDPLERLSIETSTPLWLIKLWAKQYDIDLARTLGQLGLSKPRQFARLNRLKGKREALLAEIRHHGIDFEEVPENPDAISVKGANIATTEAYRKGWVTVQDLSSQWVGKIVDPKPGERVLDCCAAPGGKATHLAELMGNQGIVIAGDLYDHKLELIAHHAKRLGTTIVKPIKLDATKLTTYFPKEHFDRVLLDAPCSGFGVIHRKPEIKYLRKPEDLDALVRIQQQMIDEAVQLVKPKGRLVYSTCTINRKENERMVDYLLSHHPEWELDPTPFAQLGLKDGGRGYVQLIDSHLGSDAFFISCFQRKG